MEQGILTGIEGLNESLKIFIDLLDSKSIMMNHIIDGSEFLRYDNDIENTISTFLDTLLENGGLDDPDVLNIHSDSNGIYLTCDNTIWGITSVDDIQYGTVNIHIDHINKILSIEGNVEGSNSDPSGGRFLSKIKYKEMDKYVDQIIELKFEVDKKKLLSNINIMYNIAGLNRVRNLKDIGI